MWNDPRGGYAFIREDVRYGHYLPPADASGLYYEMLSDDEIDTFLSQGDVLGFVDVARPMGWTYAKQEDGDQLKYGQNLVKVEGPVVDITTGMPTEGNEIMSETESYLDDWMSDSEDEE